MSAEDDSKAAREAHERRIRRCSSCGARIVWLVTKNLKHIPVDADTVNPGDEKLELPRHISHFATCPDAKKFRRKKR
jgi:hypothetical protein